MMASLKGSNISLSLCVNDMLMLLSIISWGNDTCNELISLVEVKLVIPSLERLSGALIFGWRTEDECLAAVERSARLTVGESCKKWKWTFPAVRRFQKIMEPWHRLGLFTKTFSSEQHKLDYGKCCFLAVTNINGIIVQIYTNTKF